jgi:hypothetical protein
VHGSLVAPLMCDSAGLIDAGRCRLAESSLRGNPPGCQAPRVSDVTQPIYRGALARHFANEPGSLAITVGFSALQSGSHRICSPALHRKMLIVDICPVSAATSSEYRYRVPKSAIERSQSWRKPRPPKFDGPAVAGQAQGNAENRGAGPDIDLAAALLRE